MTTAARNWPAPVAAKKNTAVPKPATSGVLVCRRITSTSRLLMPSTIRCAASPARVAATVGTAATVRMPCIHPVATAYITDPWIARTLSSGPSRWGGNRHANHSASATGIATIKMIAAAPVSLAPNSQRGTSMKIAPRNAAAPPVAVAIEFINTTCFRGTTCGSAADSPDETKRVNPLTIRAATRIVRSSTLAASSEATASTISRRPTLAPTSTRRRSHRSSSAPANGPSSE